MAIQMVKNSQDNLEKEQKVVELKPSYIKTNYKATVIKSVVLAQG